MTTPPPPNDQPNDADTKDADPAENAMDELIALDANAWDAGR